MNLPNNVRAGLCLTGCRRLLLGVNLYAALPVMCSCPVMQPNKSFCCLLQLMSDHAMVYCKVSHVAILTRCSRFGHDV